MNLAPNFAGNISPSQFGGKQASITPDIDLNDKTFSDILDKQINNKINPAEKVNSGIPNGFNIDELISMQEVNIKATEQQNRATKPINPINFDDLISKDDERLISNSEMLTFYSSLLGKNTENGNNVIADFARKQATGFYGKCAGNVVTDLGEFVSDALKIGL